jgi:hypothetical protein
MWGLVEMRGVGHVKRLTWDENLFQFPNKRLTALNRRLQYGGGGATAVN